MTIYQNTFEGGTDTTVITTANSGGTSGTAFSAVTGSPTFSTVGATSGLGCRWNLSTATAWSASWAVTATATIAIATDIYFTSLPTAYRDFVIPVNTSSSPVCKVTVGPAGQLRLNDFAGTQLWQAASAITTGVHYRFELEVNVGTSTSDGTLTFRYFNNTAPTTVIEARTSSGTDNAGGVSINKLNLGVGSSTAVDVTFDNVRWNPGSTTPLGPMVNTPPSVAVGGDTTGTIGSTVTVSATATDSDGTISTFTGSLTTKPSGSTATSSGSATGTGTANASLSQTFTPDVSGTYIWTATATDNGSATGTATRQVIVAGYTVTPVNTLDNTGSWTNQGGAGSIAAALSDSSDTTYIESQDTPTTSQTITLGMDQTLGTGGKYVTVRAAGTTSDRQVQFVLRQSSTVIVTSPTYTLTTSPADYQVILDDDQNAAITDVTQLSVEIIPS